jgi:hypothetical protein
LLTCREPVQKLEIGIINRGIAFGKLIQSSHASLAFQWICDNSVPEEMMTAMRVLSVIQKGMDNPEIPDETDEPAPPGL